MNPHFLIPYALPTLLLALALALKAPTLVRAWRDPDVRATTLLLALATAVLVVITPVNIDRLNKLTGIPNIASPWAYSFLTAFCATELTMIMRWREEPSARRRRRMITVYWVYAGIIAALWVTFLLADVPRPRIYDLDTYYANTPWMREHTMLYIVAHTVSCLVAASMLWKWFPEVTNRWLKTGVIFLQLGYALGLVFDALKFIAIGARWTGGNLDFLSTNAAPPFALLEATFVAIGFIAPQAGPFIQQRHRDQRDYRRLRSLSRAIRVVQPAGPLARLNLWTPLDLRLLARRQRIHDSLRLLSPFYDYSLYNRAYTTAVASHGESAARGIAGAVAIQAATAAYQAQTPRSPGSGPASAIGPDITNHIDAIASALQHPRTTDSIRQRVTGTESTNAHA
ncbi:MAB_1171c family putative transporter [Streptomyces sp. NPDC048514]|uniref:MAB_1171c family putative transporter n=1 Tax=Streptomyces sp. NPDC048514 TaxID=3365564 RepID=UPI003723FE8B